MKPDSRTESSARAACSYAVHSLDLGDPSRLESAGIETVNRKRPPCPAPSRPSRTTRRTCLSTVKQSRCAPHLRKASETGRPTARGGLGLRLPHPFVVTRRAYEAAIQWDKGGLMSQSARASDVLWMALPAVRRAARTTTTPLPFQLHSTENRRTNGTVNTSARSWITTLHLVVQPFGDGNLDCVTILMPDEV